MKRESAVTLISRPAKKIKVANISSEQSVRA